MGWKEMNADLQRFWILWGAIGSLALFAVAWPGMDKEERKAIKEMGALIFLALDFSIIVSAL